MGDFFAIIGLVGVAVAAVALVRGRLDWAGMGNRRTAMFAFVVAAGVLLTGTALLTPAGAPGAIAAKDPNWRPQSVVDTLPTTTVPPGTTTTAPPTTPTTTTTTATRPPTTARHTTRPATTTAQALTVPLTCAASVPDPAPADDSTIEVIVRTGVPGAAVTATAHFGPATTSHSAYSASDAIARIALHIGRWAYGYPVMVRVRVSDGATSQNCATTIIPLPN